MLPQDVLYRLGTKELTAQLLIRQRIRQPMDDLPASAAVLICGGIIVIGRSCFGGGRQHAPLDERASVVVQKARSRLVFRAGIRQSIFSPGHVA